MPNPEMVYTKYIEQSSDIKIEYLGICGNTSPVYNYPTILPRAPVDDFHNQYAFTMNALLNWGKEHSTMPVSDLNRAFSRYNENFNNKALGSSFTAERYAELKKYFENILHFLKHGPKPFQEKVSIYNKMIDQFSACAPGMYISISDIESELKQLDSIEYWLALTRKNIIVQIAEEWLQLKGYRHIMSIHVRAAFFEMARILGLAPIEVSKNRDIHKEDILEKYQNEIMDVLCNEFSGYYTTDVIINAISFSLCESVYSQIEKWRDIKTQKISLNHYSELAAALQPKLDLIARRVNKQPCNIPLDMLLDFNETDILVHSREHFLKNIKPYITAFLYDNGYVTIDNQFSLDYTVKSGTIIHIPGLDTKTCWVERTELGGRLQFLDQFMAEKAAYSANDPIFKSLKLIQQKKQYIESLPYKISRFKQLERIRKELTEDARCDFGNVTGVFVSIPQNMKRVIGDCIDEIKTSPKNIPKSLLIIFIVIPLWLVLVQLLLTCDAIKEVCSKATAKIKKYKFLFKNYVDLKNFKNLESTHTLNDSAIVNLKKTEIKKLKSNRNQSCSKSQFMFFKQRSVPEHETKSSSCKLTVSV